MTILLDCVYFTDLWVHNPIRRSIKMLPNPITVVLEFPITRIKSVSKPRFCSRRCDSAVDEHLVWAALCGGMSIFSIATALPALHHHKGLGDWSELAMALFWVSMCIDHLHSASRAESVQSSSRHV